MEACALLMGERTGNKVVVKDLALSDNVSDGDRGANFEIDPEVYLAAQKAARVGAPAVVGVWHSHPDGEPFPSDADRQRSHEPGWLWLITAVGRSSAETCAFEADKQDSHCLFACGLAITAASATESSQSV